MSDIFTLAQVLRDHAEARLMDVHTAMPGRVEAYDSATQLADVKPLLKRVYVDAEGNELVESLPVIPSVPVAFPRGGGYFISFPVEPGDYVELIFCERSIDQWMAQGGEVDPADPRLHPLDGAVAIAGVYPSTEALPDAHAENMALGKSGGTQIHFKPDGVVYTGEGATDFVALSTLVQTQLTALKNAIAGAAVAPGDGGATFKANIGIALAAWPGSVAATKAKAE